jgi:hypothetical protein
VSRLPTRGPLVCLLAALAACAPIRRPTAPTVEPASHPTTFVVARDAATTRAAIAPTAPALVGRPTGTAAEPAVLPLASTRIAATVVGPLATLERAKSYRTGDGALDAWVAFTPPAAPARQDHVVRIDGRILTILVRDRREAAALAAEQPGTAVIAPGANGLVSVPVGTLAGRATRELVVETTGIVPWREGAYELTIPRVPDGDVALAAEVYGPGQICVLNSPSHPIDFAAVSLEHLRVRLREPETLRDQDFVLRYRVDPRDRAGALVVEPDGAGTIVGVVLHPFEANHEPVGASDVHIDWNGAQVTDVRPATIGPLAAGTPLVVLARAQGEIGPIVVRAKVGREARTIDVKRIDGISRAGLRALPLLWARAVRPPAGPRR